MIFCLLAAGCFFTRKEDRRDMLACLSAEEERNMASYLIWKDRNCNGKNIEWVQLTQEEFRKFIKDPAEKERWFIVMDNRVCREDEIIVIEATREKYEKWKREENHRAYLDRFEKGYENVPFFEDTMEDGINPFTGETFAACSRSAEEIALDSLEKEEMRDRIERLSDQEKKIFYQYVQLKLRKTDEGTILRTQTHSRYGYRRMRDEILRKLRSTEQSICQM